jgi:NADH:ubiquinone oxidoreductase subunit D
VATSLNFSPIHLASTQGLGAFALRLEEDGGLVSSAGMEVGFGRRHIECISQQLPYSQALNYADRVDYLAAPAYSYALAACFEELLGLDVPERALHIRLVLLELNRISSHLHYYARLAKTVGQMPLMNHCQRERERFSDIMEMYCGSRLGFGAVCLGGVMEDATDGWFFRIEKAIASTKEFLPELQSSLLAHPFFGERARGLAVISAEQAESWNFSGPTARASGYLGTDARERRPYGAYKALERTGVAPRDQAGDTLARAWARLDDILQAAELIDGCFKKIPSGNHRIRVGIDVVPPAGKAFTEVEGPRGSIAVLAESRGDRFPANVKFFGPSSMVARMLPELLTGIQLDDVFLVTHSLDVSFSEVDK